MKRSHFSSLGLGILLLGLVPTSAMGVTIDLFNDVDDDPNDPDDNSNLQIVIRDRINTDLLSNTDSGLSDVIDGYRTIDLEIVNQNSPSSRAESAFYIDTSVYQDNPINKAILDTGNGLTPRTNIIWDGGDGTLGTSGVDLTDGGGHNSFLLDINTVLGEVTLSFNVEDTNNKTGSISKNITSNGEHFFSYNDPAASAVDFSSIKSISLATSNEPDSLSYSYNSLKTAVEVPFEFSPSLGIILCGSFFGVYKLRQKLQSN